MALISLAEWCEKVGIDSSTARHRAINGTLPAVKIGRNWVIEEDVELVDHRAAGYSKRWRKDEVMTINDQLQTIMECNDLDTLEDIFFSFCDMQEKSHTDDVVSQYHKNNNIFLLKCEYENRKREINSGNP